MCSGFYFYYHEEVMAYAALLCAFLLGALHEYSSSWITNNTLALSSIYVVVSRVQVSQMPNYSLLRHLPLTLVL